MLYLRANLAKHEVNVARYYMKRGAYMAAANRATLPETLMPSGAQRPAPPAQIAPPEKK